MICAITGMKAVTLQPAAGAAGELTGLMLMRAFHEANGETRRKDHHPQLSTRNEPRLCHPRRLRASSRWQRTLAVVSTSTSSIRRVDDDVAGIMLTNPSTLGLFEEDIVEIASAVHDAAAFSITTAPT